jgi:hypothetical protein
VEDDLKKKRKRKKGRRPNTNNSQFLLNLGANLSWGWLSSLRFLLFISENYQISSALYNAKMFFLIELPQGSKIVRGSQYL